MPGTCVDYTHAIYPSNSIDIRRHLAAGARRLQGKIKALQLPDESISPFIRAYFRSNIDHFQAAMQRYSFLLSWALRSRRAEGLEDVVLVDYGGGSGVLSLLAREIGIGTVIYVDIYDVCCRDAQSIGRRLNLEADHYVHADTEELVAYLRKKELVCNTVMSYDALEHIYDIDHFFHHLQGITQGPLTLTLASGANPLNPIINRRLMRLHRKVETQGTLRRAGDDERNPEIPLVALRESIVVEHITGMDRQVVNLLARRTRGRNKSDILRAVSVYREQGVLPVEIEHPTNTCDPYTDNWCERLLDPCRLGEELRQLGFRVDVFPGYYGSVMQDSAGKRWMRDVANFLISGSARMGLRLAPYYCINAVR